MFDEIVKRIKDDYRWAAYSPKLNRIVLLRGGRTELVSEKGKHLEFYYSYADKKSFGKTMKVGRFESLYTVCWEL